MWSMLGLIYMHIFLTDLRTLKWLFAQLTRPTHSAAIMKKKKKIKLKYLGFKRDYLTFPEIVLEPKSF